MLLRSAATLLGSAVLAGCSVVGVRAGTEQPSYDVVASVNNAVEIRQYGNRVAIETTVDRGGRSANENSAFGALAGYIFGKNRSRSEIAMTSPVEMQARSEKIAMTSPVESKMSSGTMTMRFFLPSGYTTDSAPIPLNPNVKVIDVAPETIATLRFTGMRTSSNVATHTAELLNALEDSPWQPAGEPTAYFYDPPWTVPSLRRNEVAVPVVRDTNELAEAP